LIPYSKKRSSSHYGGMHATFRFAVSYVLGLRMSSAGQIRPGRFFKCHWQKFLGIADAAVFQMLWCPSNGQSTWRQTDSVIKFSSYYFLSLFMQLYLNT